MFRKEFRQHLWVILVPALLGIAALTIRLFHLGWSNYTPRDLIDALFLFTFFFVFHLVAFLLGLFLFSGEKWLLLLTLPRGKVRILFEKGWAGFLLLLASTFVTFTLFALAAPVSFTLLQGVLFGLIFANLFLLGILTSQATEKLIYALLIVAFGGFAAFLLTILLGLRPYLYLAHLLIGALLFYILLLLSLLLLKLYNLLFPRMARLFHPRRNALAGFALFIIHLFILAGVSTLLLHRMTTIASPRNLDSHRSWAIPMGASRLAITSPSTNLLFLSQNGPFHSLTGGRWDNLALYDTASRKIKQLTRYDSVRYSTAPDPKGEHLAYLSFPHYPPDAWNWRLKIVDKEGKPLLNLPLDRDRWNSFKDRCLFWGPEEGRCNLLERRDLLRIDITSGKIEAIQLPPNGFGPHGSPVFDFHFAFILESSLTYVRRYGNEGYEIWEYDMKRGEWIPVSLEGERGDEKTKPAGGWHWYRPAGETFWFRNNDVGIFKVNGKIIHPHLPLLKEVAYWMCREGFFTFEKERMTFQRWGEDEPLYTREKPEGWTHAFSWHGRTFLSITKADKRSGKYFYSTRFTFIETLTGQPMKKELHVAGRVDWNISRRGGPIAVVPIVSDTDRTFYRVNLESLAIDKVLEIPSQPVRKNGGINL